MRCKSCEYRLWNLTSRQCPECGEPFVPSDFEFVINSVQFCCPHCDKAYYGTGEKGHLQPRQFQCVQCQNTLDMDQMVLRPTEDVREEQTQVDRNPWLQRSERGRIRSWFATLGRSIALPIRLMRATPEASSAGQALLFMVVTHLMFFAVALLPIALIALVTAGFLLRGGRGIAVMSSMATFFGGTFVIGILVYLLFVVIWGLITHLLLKLGGKPAFGLGRTFHALTYSCGGNVLCAIPWCGMYMVPIGVIWWTVNATVMVKEGQQVSSGRAAFAVISFPAVVLAACVGLIVWGLITTISAMNAVNTNGNANVAAAIVNNAIIAQAYQNNGTPPAHVIELVASGQLSASQFVDGNSHTAISDIPVGDTTLDQFELLSSADRNTIAATVAANLPANPVAHRLGDFVFVYHGMNFTRANPQLWTVIDWPDPDVNAVKSRGLIKVALVNGSTRKFSISLMTPKLAAQNALRAKMNLPSIPHPSTVKHSPP